MHAKLRAIQLGNRVALMPDMKTAIVVKIKLPGRESFAYPVTCWP